MRQAAFVLCLVFGCAGEPADEVGRAAGALTPVSWTDLIGVSSAGNDLTKSAPETSFNAGAVSVQTLPADGYVEFSSAEATTDKLAGLSVGNGGAGYQDIDFAIRLNGSGRASVYEGGVNRGGIGPYAAGDVFRVQAEDGVVTYWRNGKLKYTSAVAPSFPLLVDTSLRTPGATITDVALEPIDFWTAAVNVAVDGRDITKTAPEDQYNAGAISLGIIASGDGFVEFRVADNTSWKAAGLGNGNSNNSRNDIEFAIALTDTGGITVYESGVSRGGFGPYTVGDEFRVEVAGGLVRYLKNRIPFYTSALAPTYPLLLDTAIRTPGASILDARLVAGYLTDDCAPLVQNLPGGASMDAAGDLMVVGNPAAMPSSVGVYRETAGTWALEDTLASPDALAQGGRVSTDGHTIAALAFDGQIGHVRLYRHDGAQWIDEGVVDGCDTTYGLRSLAVQGDVLVAGEPYATNGGRVFVFRRNAGVWTLDGILTRPGTVFNDLVGFQVTVGGSRVFASARHIDGNGVVDVFRYNPAAPDPSQPPSCSFIDPGKWRLTTELASPPDPHDYWGQMDANLDGTRLLIGDHRDDAHLFELSGGVWSQIALLTPYPPEFTGDYVALGGPGPKGDSVAVLGDNAGYIYAELEGGWTQIDYVPMDSVNSIVAAAADSVFLRSAEVYRLDPVCLQE
jgi:hypothetical protein